jgi:histidine kinase
VSLNFIRTARLPLLIKIVLCTGIPFLLAVCLIFSVDFRQYADPTFPPEQGQVRPFQFVFTNVTVLAVTVLIFIGLVYVVLRGLVLLPVRRMIAGIEKIRVGERVSFEAVDQNDELGRLASAIREVGEEVITKHSELSKQREIYWQLFDAAPCMITVQNRKYEVVRYNKYFAEHFAVGDGMHCYEAYKNQSWKCEDCPTEKAFETGRPHFSEESGFYKDGTRAQWMVNASPMFDAEGNVVAAMSVSLDITARKKLEEEIKRSEKKYFATFNNMPYALFLIDRERLVITDCNRSSTVLYGYTKGQMIGKSFLDFFVEADRSGYESALRSLSPIHRARHAARDGKVLYVNIDLTDSEYQVRGKVVLATVIDITERIETEQQVIQANKMATLGEMATGVAHELNQPLSVIQMISSLFSRKLERGEMPDRKTLLEISSKLQSNVERASKIINHMREFGRKSTLEAGSVQVNEVILKSLDFFSQQLRLRDIEVVLELKEDLPKIKADANRLEQVFVNLLTNARDAIEEKVLQDPSSEAGRKITIRTRSNRRYVFAEICDSGIGIPKEIRHRLFEPFFTTKDVGRGTGLGLSISYRIVTDYGGTIHAVSREKEGACFEIIFPREVAMKTGNLKSGGLPPEHGSEA